ncbi:MAG TPA: hypothetical protein VLD40_01815 [Dissulfurispiraceae bacterium]|nr:hypothetical protein [Dissulfurispiraceae bacterium]
MDTNELKYKDSMFYRDSRIRYSEEKGFGESYYILCPVCWNSSIRLTVWETGTRDEDECATCRRMERLMSGALAGEE